MNPKIDHNHIWKNVDGMITLPGIFNIQGTHYPDSACDEPSHLKADVEGEEKDHSIVTPFWQTGHTSA